MSYLSHTERDRAAMLARIGVRDFAELLEAIPEDIRLHAPLDLPAGCSELEVTRLLGELAARNRDLDQVVSFLGGGVYDHYVPAVIDHILRRSEFYTAYTPYQAEVSQGTLQAIYEYQSAICDLFAMDVANASMYDGASALAEACHMARDVTGRHEVVLAGSLHPGYEAVVRTYCQGLKIPIHVAPAPTGTIDLAALAGFINAQTAAVVVQHPNFFGALEPVTRLAALAHERGALFVVSVDPISLGIIAPPGEYGADIAVGEGQALGLAPSLGGPFLGIFTARRDHVRLMPGRIIGRTVDTAGTPGFVMTLQTREQHIRREKATSNICTNEALCALAALVYLSLLGREGIKEVAARCLAKSHYLADQLTARTRFRVALDVPFFKEFVLRTPVPARRVIDDLLADRFFAGVDLGRFRLDESLLLVAVTERRTRAELDRFVELLARY